jgi:hypothetical protein
MTRVLFRILIGVWVAGAFMAAAVAGSPLRTAQSPPTGQATTTVPSAGVLTVSPASAAVGDTIQITGTGCAEPGMGVTVVFGTPNVPVGGAEGLFAGLGSAGVDAAGAFSLAATVPRYVASPRSFRLTSLVGPGDYIIGSRSGGAICSTPFHVTGGAPGPLTITPTAGPPGTTITVTGDCQYIGRYVVYAAIDGQPVPGTELAGAGVPKLNLQLTIPAGLAAGTQVAVTGTCAGLPYDPATFTVTTTAVAASSAPATTPRQARLPVTG